ncbi:hypothetical protein CTI12_AA538320 [Artemisia annua]|uniref:Uncharacterized protein n=1 Tax=Artemisia annua TaxID=35608 RepID=A0A2U1L2D3_ARTAN|nr:hypothetical protein CTI12_AA538320 [Artemisia annua]
MEANASVIATDNSQGSKDATMPAIGMPQQPMQAVSGSAVQDDIDSTDVKNPIDNIKSATTAGTSTGLNITSNGVTTTSSTRVPVNVNPDRIMRELLAAAEVAAFTTLCDRSLFVDDTCVCNSLFEVMRRTVV